MAESPKKRTAIITGGTKGIGKAIALKLARLDYNLCLHYFSDDEAASKTVALCQQEQAQVMIMKGDVARKQDVQMLAQRCVDTFGSIDVLINNAGLNIDKPLCELTEHDWDRVVDTNMKGVFLCSQIASQYMLQQQQGGIILNVGATTGIRGRKNGINYCASKAGVLVMTKCLAMELAPKIHVNCIIPGFTWTQETESRYFLNNPENVRKKASTIPLQKIGDPQQIAEVVAFLLSPSASYIHGQKIIVDGGQFMV